MWYKNYGVSSIFILWWIWYFWSNFRILLISTFKIKRWRVIILKLGQSFYLAKPKKLKIIPIMNFFLSRFTSFWWNCPFYLKKVVFNLKRSSYLSLWKSAIHVDSSITWTLCADNLNYQTTVQDVSQYLHHALNQGATF